MPEVRECVAWLAPEGCGLNTHLDPEYSCIENDVRIFGPQARHMFSRVKLPRHTRFDICFSFPNDTQGRLLTPPGEEDWIGFRIEVKTNWDDNPNVRPLVWRMGWLLGGSIKCFNRYRHPLWKPANVSQIELTLYPMTLSDENDRTTVFSSMRWEIAEGSRRIEHYLHHNLPHGLELDDYARTGTPAHIFRAGGNQRRFAIASDKRFFVRRDDTSRRPRELASGREDQRSDRTNNDQEPKSTSKRTASSTRNEGGDRDGDLDRPRKEARSESHPREECPSASSSKASSRTDRTAQDEPVQLNESRPSCSAGAAKTAAPSGNSEDEINKYLDELLALSRAFESSEASRKAAGNSAEGPARELISSRPAVAGRKTEDPRLKMDRFKHRANPENAIATGSDKETEKPKTAPAPSTGAVQEATSSAASTPQTRLEPEQQGFKPKHHRPTCYDFSPSLPDAAKPSTAPSDRPAPTGTPEAAPSEPSKPSKPEQRQRESDKGLNDEVTFIGMRRVKKKNPPAPDSSIKLKVAVDEADEHEPERQTSPRTVDDDLTITLTLKREATEEPTTGGATFDTTSTTFPSPLSAPGAIRTSRTVDTSTSSSNTSTPSRPTTTVAIARRGPGFNPLSNDVTPASPAPTVVKKEEELSDADDEWSGAEREEEVEEEDELVDE